MMRKTIAGALALLAPVAAHASDHSARDDRRFRAKFHEVVQPIQYDGDYSPAAGRPADPEPSATVPVRYVPAWKRAIPVIVPPAPRYVDAAPARTDAAPASGAAPSTGAAPFAAATPTGTAAPAANGGAADAVAPTAVADGALPPPQTGAGSVTGATSYPNYAAALPTPSTPK